METKKNRILDKVNSVQEEQGEVTKTSRREKIQGVPQMKISATKMSRKSSKVEPLVCDSTLKKWLSITNIQEEVVSYSLDDQSLGIKKKIQVGIEGDQKDNLAEAAGNVYIFIVQKATTVQLTIINASAFPLIFISFYMHSLHIWGITH